MKLFKMQKLNIFLFIENIESIADPNCQSSIDILFEPQNHQMK